MNNNNLTICYLVIYENCILGIIGTYVLIFVLEKKNKNVF